MNNFGNAFLIHLSQGRNLPSADTFTNSSDPYVVLKWGDLVARSSVVMMSVHPVWNEDFLFYRDPESKQEQKDALLQVEVFDRDLLGEDDPLGRFDVDLSPIPLNQCVYHAGFFGKSVVSLQIMHLVIDTTEKRQTAIDCSASGSAHSIELTQSFLGFNPWNQVRNMSSENFFEAVKGGETAVVQRFMQLCPNLMQTYTQTKSVLVMASHYHYRHMVKMLVAQGIDIHQRDPQTNMSCLDVAVLNSNHKMIDLLLKLGMKVEQSSLYLAIQCQDSIILEFLMQHTPIPDWLDCFRYSVENGYAKISQYIFMHHLERMNRKRVLLLACRFGIADMVNSLIDPAPDEFFDLSCRQVLDKALLEAASGGHLQILTILIKMIIRLGVDPTTWYQAAMMAASRNSQIETVNFFSKLGITVQQELIQEPSAPDMMVIKQPIQQ